MKSVGVQSSGSGDAHRLAVEIAVAANIVYMCPGGHCLRRVGNDGKRNRAQPELLGPPPTLPRDVAVDQRDARPTQDAAEGLVASLDGLERVAEHTPHRKEPDD